MRTCNFLPTGTGRGIRPPSIVTLAGRVLIATRFEDSVRSTCARLRDWEALASTVSLTIVLATVSGMAVFAVFACEEFFL